MVHIQTFLKKVDQTQKYEIWVNQSISLDLVASRVCRVSKETGVARARFPIDQFDEAIVTTHHLF